MLNTVQLQATRIDCYSLWSIYLVVVDYFAHLSWFLPPANEVCEGYVFTPVCQSFCSGGVGSGSREFCIGGGLHPGQGSASRGGLHPGGLHPGGLDRPHPHRILRDTVNERAVCILLECILVTSATTSHYRHLAGFGYSWWNIPHPVKVHR